MSFSWLKCVYNAAKNILFLKRVTQPDGVIADAFYAVQL